MNVVGVSRSESQMWDTKQHNLYQQEGDEEQAGILIMF